MAARAQVLVFVASLAAGLWVLWPTLDAGPISDDYLFRAMLEGAFATERSPLDLFNFADGSAEEVRALQRWGSVPWWASPDFGIAMLRPLSSALFQLDHVLWPDAYRVHHLHSLSWWVVLLSAVAALYRRVLPLGLGAVALWAFALDDSHHGPALWLANRGGLVAVALGLFAVLLHVRRREGQRPGAWASAVCLALALAFGEWVFPVFAYLAAYELIGRRGDAPRARVMALLPAGVLGVSFLAIRGALGYGASGSGVYVDPGAEPLRFALFLAQRVPILLGDMVLQIPAHWWDLGTPWRNQVLSWEVISPSLWVALPGWRTFQIALGVGGALLAVGCVGWALSRAKEDERRRVTWLLAGGALSLLPVVASFPSTRLTLAAFVGVAPAIALVVRELLRWMWQPRPLWRFLPVWALTCAIVFMHLLEPLSLNMRGATHFLRGSEAWVLGAELDPDRVADQRVYLVSSMEFATTFYFPYMWRRGGHPLPRSFYPLSAARHALRFERVADDAFTLRPLGGSFLESDHELMFRHESDRMHAGQRFELPGMTVEVERIHEGLPHILRFTLDRSLDDPSVVLLASTHEGITRIDLPETGGRIRLKSPTPPSWLALDAAWFQRRMQKPPRWLAWDPFPALFTYEP